MRVIASSMLCQQYMTMCWLFSYVAVKVTYIKRDTELTNARHRIINALRMLQAIELEVTNEAKEHAAQYDPGLPSE
jgi:hypothetical protein